MKELKFSIITPTLLRSTLAKACESIHSQSYTNWRHLIAVDLCDADMNAYSKEHSNLLHSNRSWFKCPVNHHDMGNSCRRFLFSQIDADTDYIIYLDDDNYHIGESLSILNEEIQSQGCPPWGIFPMTHTGKRFLNEDVGLDRSDANQLFHSPYVYSAPIRYEASKEYSADGLLIEYLKTLVPSVCLTSLPSLVEYPMRSLGIKDSPSNNKCPYTVIIPHKFEDIIQPLIKSLEYEEELPRIVIIADGHDRSYGYEIIRTDGRFNYSRAANLGIRHCGQDDVILMNDDIRLIEPNTFKRLHEIAYMHPQIGMVTPTIDGGGYLHVDCHNKKIWNGDECVYFTDVTKDKADFVPFAIAYLKRSMLNDIGLLDEGFINYGGDDVDMNVRALAKGWKCVVARNITVRHGAGMANFGKGKSYSMSFSRTPTVGNLEYYLKKHPELMDLYLPDEQAGAHNYRKHHPSSSRHIASGTSWKTRVKEATIRKMQEALI